MKRPSILLVLLVSLGVAACASEEAASASPSEAVATPEPTPEPIESAEPSEEPTGSELAFPSFDLDGDPELAARFPDTVGGQPFEVQSMRADQMGPMLGSDPTFEAFLESIGAELSDVSFAFGFVIDPDDPESGFGATAFRILGASEDELQREFLAASEDAGQMGEVQTATVGGKEVLIGSDPTGETESSFYLYTKDDTIYFLTGGEEQAAEVLEALP